MRQVHGQAGGQQGKETLQKAAGERPEPATVVDDSPQVDAASYDQRPSTLPRRPTLKEDATLKPEETQALKDAEAKALAEAQALSTQTKADISKLA